MAGVPLLPVVEFWGRGRRLAGAEQYLTIMQRRNTVRL
jgi:hypothetical protein